MKSTRQHHLPRFILRGFGSRVRKGRSYTWVHRKALPAYEANIVNVGVEAGFYDLEGDTSVDRRITQSEGDFSELLQELIATDGRCQQQTQRISQFIHHLAVRPKSLRDGLSDIGQEMVNIVDAVFSDSNRLEIAFWNRWQRIERSMPQISKLILGNRRPAILMFRSGT